MLESDEHPGNKNVPQEQEQYFFGQDGKGY